MAQQDSGSVPMNIAEMMVAIGRIEEKVNPVENLVTRIGVLEVEVARIKDKVPKRVQFVTILTSIAAAVAILLGFANLGVLQQNKTQQAIQMELIQENQKKLAKK